MLCFLFVSYVSKWKPNKLMRSTLLQIFSCKQSFAMNSKLSLFTKRYIQPSVHWLLEEEGKTTSAYKCRRIKALKLTYVHTFLYLYIHVSIHRSVLFVFRDCGCSPNTLATFWLCSFGPYQCMVSLFSRYVYLCIY